MRHFPNWLTAYADYTSVSEAPANFHFWVGVSTIAAALRRKVYIDQRIFQWTPNFYIILVGPPGIVSKSTTVRIGYRLLRQVSGIHFGPQSMTWQGLLLTLEQAQELYVAPGQDLTVLDPVKVERIPMSCVSCDVSELGTFLQPKNDELTSFLINMWDGQVEPWQRSLATRETVTIENPWLNMIACTTPGWLRDNFQESLIYGGLMSRCVFAWGNQKRRLIAYPGEHVTPDAHTEKQQKLVADLQNIAELNGPMRLTSDAVAWGETWYEKHYTHRPEQISSERFEAYWARKQTHFHKLAMILSAAAGNSMIITSEMLQLAEQIITDSENDLVQVVGSITTTTSAKHVDEIMRIVRRNKSITRQTLWRHCIRHMTEMEFTNAITASINAGYLQQSVTQGRVSYVPTPQTTTSSETSLRYEK